MGQPTDPIKLEVALTERLQDYAAARGIDLQEAFGTALGLGAIGCPSGAEQPGRPGTIVNVAGMVSTAMRHTAAVATPPPCLAALLDMRA
jgi:hypothetical protein